MASQEGVNSAQIDPASNYRAILWGALVLAPSLAVVLFPSTAQKVFETVVLGHKRAEEISTPMPVFKIYWSVLGAMSFGWGVGLVALLKPGSRPGVPGRKHIATISVIIGGVSACYAALMSEYKTVTLLVLPAMLMFALLCRASGDDE